ncbi:hypothetical protein ACQEVX_35380 [Streptomyces syringium]|uniref:hypothetical protein n=1 Tax=Streptomyces syringium TaxID=76729 RepID=UPI003D89D384
MTRSHKKTRTESGTSPSPGHAMVEVLLEFVGSVMKKDDTARALTRMETLHAATYEDLQQPGRRWPTGRPPLADRRHVTRGPELVRRSGPLVTSGRS